jgi:Flp pilus assembly protein TadG
MRVTQQLTQPRQMRRLNRKEWLRLWRRLQRNEGGALIEMALVLPILLTILTGIFSISIVLSNYMVLTNGVAIGARLAAISRAQTTDPCSAAVTAAEATTSPFLKSSNLTFSFNINGSPYPSVTSCTAGAAALNAGQGQPLTVTATYPCSVAIYGANLIPSCTLTAQTTEIIQ